MEHVQVSYDTQSGRIISMHSGAVDAKAAHHSAQAHAKSHTGISVERIAILTVPANAFERRKLYKVDVAAKTLVSATAADGGAGGGFGKAGHSG